MAAAGGPGRNNGRGVRVAVPGHQARGRMLLAMDAQDRLFPGRFLFQAQQPGARQRRIQPMREIAQVGVRQGQGASANRSMGRRLLRRKAAAEAWKTRVTLRCRSIVPCAAARPPGRSPRLVSRRLVPSSLRACASPPWRRWRRRYSSSSQLSSSRSWRKATPSLPAPAWVGATGGVAGRGLGGSCWTVTGIRPWGSAEACRQPLWVVPRHGFSQRAGLRRSSTRVIGRPAARLENQPPGGRSRTDGRLSDEAVAQHAIHRQASLNATRCGTIPGFLGGGHGAVSTGATLDQRQ